MVLFKFFKLQRHRPFMLPILAQLKFKFNILGRQRELMGHSITANCSVIVFCMCKIYLHNLKVYCVLYMYENFKKGGAYFNSLRDRLSCDAISFFISLIKTHLRALDNIHIIFYFANQDPP